MTASGSGRWRARSCRPTTSFGAASHSRRALNPFQTFCLPLPGLSFCLPLHPLPPSPAFSRLLSPSLTLSHLLSRPFLTCSHSLFRRGRRGGCAKLRVHDAGEHGLDPGRAQARRRPARMQQAGHRPAAQRARLAGEDGTRAHAGRGARDLVTHHLARPAAAEHRRLARLERAASPGDGGWQAQVGREASGCMPAGSKPTRSLLEASRSNACPHEPRGGLPDGRPRIRVPPSCDRRSPR